MAINLDVLAISIIIRILILAPILWLSGRFLVGPNKAKVTDAIWIIVLGTVVGGIFEYLFSGLIASIIILFIWLILIKHFFNCGLIKAIIISIFAVVIFCLLAVALTFFGLEIWSFPFL